MCILIYPFELEIVSVLQTVDIQIDEVLKDTQQVRGGLGTLTYVHLSPTLGSEPPDYQAAVRFRLALGRHVVL